MSVILGLLRRDWRIARSRPAPYALDAASVLIAAALFYYLGRTVSPDHGPEFFAFAVAGLAILRIHSAVPRVVVMVNGEIASGSLELLVSSSRRTALVVIGVTAYELLRSLVLSMVLILLAVVLFDAPFAGGVKGVAAMVVGLQGAVFIFAGLAAGVLGVIMVVRQAGGIASLATIVMPVLTGAYFPIKTLPEPVETIALLLPFRRAVDLVRDGMLEGRFPLGDVIVLELQAVALLGCGLLVAHFGIERARRAGSLGLE